jgi:Hypothetical protein (DUF2513)
MTSEKLIRNILLQARQQPHGKKDGWIRLRVSGVSAADLSLHIREASERGLIDACDVTHLASPHDEWKVQNITASGLQFLEDSKFTKKARMALWAALVAGVAFLGWLIPVLISILKR